MTVKIKKPMKQPEFERLEKLLLKGEFKGKEFAEEQKKILQVYEYPKVPKNEPVLRPKMEEALKRINLPSKHFGEWPSEILEGIKKMYQDFKDGKISEVCDLWQLCKKYPKPKKIRKKDHFFFGLVLIMIAESEKKNCKKPVNHDWRTACELMAHVTGNDKYLDDYYSKSKRKTIYRDGLSYIKIIIEAYETKIEIDNYLADLKKGIEIYNRSSRAMIKATMRFGYDLNLTKRIHSYLMENKVVKPRDIERYFNKRRKDTYPCLWFLERVGEIFCDMKKQINRNRQIYYIGNGKDLEEVLPLDVSSFIFNKFSNT